MDLHPRAKRIVTASLLELEGISKSFGDVPALTNVALRLRRNSLHALLGENGAGKTTLMNIAYGLLRPDQGKVFVAGAPCRIHSPAAALDAGIGMVQQHFSLVPAMTVAENISLGIRGPYRPAALRKDVIALADSTGLHINPDARVADLSIAGQQRVEILKALARSVRILILDEPTALLSPQESTELLHWIRTFCVDGRGAVLITHKLEEARAVSDDVTVLRGGVVVMHTPTADVTTDQLVRAMVGEGIAHQGPSRDVSSPGVVIVCAERITIRDKRGVEHVRDASFEIRAGEIVGLAGVEGAGHRELLRAAAGRLAPTSGSLKLPNRIGYAPEDRLHDALIPEFDLRENLALHGAGAKRGLLHWRQLEQSVVLLLQAFDVRAPSARAHVATLSGGNQQKFVYARELRDQPDLLVAVNPTRGLDTRACSSQMARLRIARDNGMAIIVHSSDVDELLALCDRILVAYAGRVREVPCDRDTIGRAMVGSA